MTRRRSCRIRRDDQRDKAALIVCVFVVLLSVIMFYLGFSIASVMRWG